jgi:hypothetical protein
MKIWNNPRRLWVNATNNRPAAARIRNGLRQWWWIILGLLACSVSALPAVEFSTTNRDSLTRFWSALESSNRPVTVISFGDSMADSYRSPTYHLVRRLVDCFGVAGYSLNNYGNTGAVQITNGAAHVMPDQNWFNRYQSVPPGGAAWWINLPNPSGNYCDRAGIFYIAHPQGGQWQLQISTNGGPWGTVLSVDGYSPTPTGQLAMVSLPANRYRVRAAGLTGTNYVLGPYTLNSQTNGLHVVFTDWQGISLGQVTNVSPAIREPVFAALQPDLIVWHMKETEDLSTSNRMEVCEVSWQATIPECDVLYLGTPWTYLDTNYPSTMLLNTIVRNIALRHQRAYSDIMQPTISYPWLVTNGFMADEVHLNSAGGLYCANLLWNDLGFYALGVDRRITLQSVGPQLELSYQTTTNAIYHLEFSTNLVQWSGVFTNPIGGGPFSTNFTPAAGAVFYRVGLAPR